MSTHPNPPRIPIHPCRPSVPTPGKRSDLLAAILVTTLSAATALSLAACSTATPGGPAAPAGSNTSPNTSPDTGPNTSAPSAGATAAGSVNPGAGGSPGTAVPSTTPEPTFSAAQAQATARVVALQPVYMRSIGTRGTDPGQIMLPNDVAVDSHGNIYVSDSKGVTKFDAGGQFLMVIDTADVKIAHGIAVGSADQLYVTGAGPQVFVFDAKGNKTGTVGTPGKEPGQLANPVDVAVGKDGSIYVADVQNHRVEKYDAAGKHLMSIDPKGDFRAPRCLAIGPKGQIYVGMGDDFLVNQFSPEGKPLASFGHSQVTENLWRTGGIAVDGEGKIYVTQSVSHVLQAFTASDKPTLAWEYGQLGTPPVGFNTPLGMDIKGKDLYLVDQANNLVQVLQLK